MGAAERDPRRPPQRGPAVPTPWRTPGLGRGSARPPPPLPAPWVPGGSAAAGAGGGAEPAAAAQEGKFGGAGAAGAGGAAPGAPRGEWGLLGDPPGVARRAGALVRLRCALQPATSGRLVQPGRMVRLPASRCPAAGLRAQARGGRAAPRGSGAARPGRARHLQGGARGRVMEASREGPSGCGAGCHLASPIFIVAFSCLMTFSYTHQKVALTCARLATLRVLGCYFCCDGEGGGGVPRVAGDSVLSCLGPGPWSSRPRMAGGSVFVRSVEGSCLRTWSGVPGFAGRGGGGKLYKEKAKLFPRHFLHLRYRQWF